MDVKQIALKEHYQWKGKIEVVSRAEITNAEQLSIAYTPGVAEPCLVIQQDYSKSFELTRRWNMVAVITDGSAVLGLGDIGPEAGMPVMEGKRYCLRPLPGWMPFPSACAPKTLTSLSAPCT